MPLFIRKFVLIFADKTLLDLGLRLLLNLWSDNKSLEIACIADFLEDEPVICKFLIVKDPLPSSFSAINIKLLPSAFIVLFKFK